MNAGAESPVFVGRRSELALLTGLAQRARAGEAALALIGGEAGVGKSRLAEEFSSQASGAGFTVLTGYCIELGADGLPLAPLVGALRTLARTTPPGELAEVLGPSGRGLARLLPELAPSAATQQAEDIRPAQLMELVLGLLTRLSASQPVLLMLEDLHWADQSTLELVAFLVRSLRDAAVLLVATYRSDELHRRHPLRPLITGWERVRVVSRVQLDRFDQGEVAAQLAGILSGEPAAPLVAKIFGRSGGNAYLVEELAGVVRAGGDPEDLPPSLMDVLLSRVDSLSPAAQQLLRVASVAGRGVPDRLLAEVAGIPDAEFFAALREAVESNLLVVDKAGRGYEFRHALTRDAVYEEMLPGERVRLHAGYGAALARDPRLAGDDAAVPAALAHHWYAALDLPRALAASVAAANHAMTSFAPAEAGQHLERALQIWPRVPDAPERTGLDLAELTGLAADAAYFAGDVSRSISLIDQALAELPAEAGPVRRALMMERRARSQRDLSREADATATLEQALTLLPADQVTTAHAIVLAALAASLLRRSDLTTAAKVAERAVRTAQAAGVRQQEADALITLGSARAYLNNEEGGLADLRAGLALALGIEATTPALRGYVNLSDALELLGRHAEAAKVATEGLTLAANAGLARTLGAYLTGNVADPLLRLGRWNEASGLLEQALSASPEGIFAVTLVELRGELAAMRGRFGDAETDLRTAYRLAGQSTDAQFVQTMLYADGLVAHGRGDLATAREQVATGLGGLEHMLLARYAWPLLWLGMRIEADEATRARDRRVEVPELSLERRDDLAAVAAELTAVTPPARGYLALVTAEQARAAGQDDTGAWSAAVTAWREAGEPYPLAYALLRLAEVQCGTDRQQAAASVSEARAIATRLGAAPLAEEVAALARRARLQLDDGPAASDPSPPAEAGGTAPAGRRADEFARFGLTDREREVLVLLAAGKTNPQIAQALFISPKTASVHVSNILAKLGVSGRVEAAAVAHRLGGG
jgi:ATP/maltotriose-dependent transcriptional regulator MalT